jgi:RNase P subunit RPR2
MSSAAEITPTLEYLTDAAHLLQTTAPGTSAHLMSQRGELMWQRDISLSEVQRQHVCGACGNIMIPGNTSALRLDARRARYTSKKSKANLQKPEKRGVKDLTKVIQCKRCDRKTKTNIDPVPRSKATNKPTLRAATHQAEPSADSPPPKATSASAQSNASSKKRAKNRKAGLQALLSGQQQQKSKSLSLADFMQK